MKKLLSFFLIAALLLVFAACGNPAAENTEGASTASTEAPTAAGAANETMPWDELDKSVGEIRASLGEVVFDDAGVWNETIPWDKLGKRVGEIRASLGEVVSDDADVWLDAAMCGFREKDKKLIYFLFGTQEIMWDDVPGYADQLVVAGFCVTPAMLLPGFKDGMTAADFLTAIGVTLDENAYWAEDDFGEEYSLSYMAGSEKLSMSIASDTVYGEGRRALRADDYILIYSAAYTEKNEGDLGTKIPWDIISADSNAAWENQGQ